MVLAEINFLHRGLYDAMFWIVIENQCDNTPMLSVVAERYLYRVKDFSTSCAALSMRRLGKHKKLGGTTARSRLTKDIFHTTWRHA